MCVPWVRLGQPLRLSPAPGHDACLNSLAAPFLDGLDGLKGLDVASQLITDVRASAQETLVAEDQ